MRVPLDTLRQHVLFLHMKTQATVKYAVDINATTKDTQNRLFFFVKI